MARGIVSREDTPLVVYVDHVGELGGTEMAFLADARLHWAAGQRVMLACPPESALASRATRLGVPVIGLPFPPVLDATSRVGKLRASTALLASTIQLRNILRRECPDIVCGVSAKGAIIGGTAAKLITPRPLVVTLNTESFYFGREFSSSFYNRRLRQAAVRLSDYVVVHSLARHKQLEAFIGRDRAVCGRTPMHLHPYAVADGSAVREELGFQDDAVLVGMAGQLIAWKGQREFLKAAAITSARHPNARFVIVGDATISGDPTHPEELRALCLSLGIDERVHFLGWRDDMPQVMASLDVFVLPSHHEPFGRVVVEAMAASRPVIATASGGPLELIVHERTGLLVPPRDVEALADTMSRLVADSTLRRSLGAAAGRWVRDCFGFDPPFDLTMAGLCARLLHRRTGSCDGEC